MGLILDGVIVLFILLSAFLGYRKGLITLGIQLVAFIVALIIGLILYRPIAGIIINSTQIDENLQSTIQANIEDMEENNDNNIVKGIVEQGSREIAINIIYGVTLLILFIIARIVLIFISALANLVAKLPILKQFNKIGGVIYGVLRGMIITYAILMIISLIITLNPKSSIADVLNDSYLAKSMSTYNILNVFF